MLVEVGELGSRLALLRCHATQVPHPSPRLPGLVSVVVQTRFHLLRLKPYTGVGHAEPACKAESSSGNKWWY